MYILRLASCTYLWEFAMSTIRFTCPHCGATVRSNAVRDEQNCLRAACPECEGSVAVRNPDCPPSAMRPAEETSAAKTAQEGIRSAESVSPLPRREGAREIVRARHQYRDAGRRRRRKEASARAAPWPLIVGISVGAVVLIVGVVVAAALFAYRVSSSVLNEKQQPLAQPAGVNGPMPPGDAPPNGEQAGLPPGVRSHVAWNPVPQESPEKMKARRQARRAWVKATTLDAYERIGHKDPKWDAAARESLKAVFRLWCKSVKVGDDRVACWKAAHRAIKAGCDDPFIQYLHARLGYDLNPITKEEKARELGLAANALENSGYPAVRKANAHYNTAADLIRLPLTPERKAEVERRLSATLALIPEILKEDHPEARADALEMCYLITKHYLNIFGDRKKAIERVTAVLRGDPAWQPLLLCVRGEAYITYAWDARGTGWANTVTPGVWRLFYQRLHEAEKDLSKAWDMDHSLYQAANGMITVAMGLGWNHEKMEVWFQRAMKANSDNLVACGRKLEYLQPRWHGSWQEVLAFGRGCRATKNWEGGLPFILEAAHFSLAGRSEKSPYLRQRGVWEEIQPLYKAYLKLHPESHYNRAMCALWAYRCGHYKEADHLFQQLDDDDWVDVFSSAAAYQRIVDDTRQHLKAGG